MKPRLPSSKKWTAFPLEFVQQIIEALREAFPTQAKAGQFIVDGRIYTEEVLVRIGYLETGRLKQMNVEVSMNCSPKDLDASDRIMNCVDAAASVLQEYFEQTEESETEFPTTWKSFQFDEHQMFMQTSTVNTQLESMADQLLGQSQQEMVHEEDSETEDALEKSDFFEVTDEDDPKKRQLH